MALEFVPRIVIWIIIIIISAIPLNIAVKLMGGKSSIVKVLIVNLTLGILSFLIEEKVRFFGGIISFLALLFIYKSIFELGWIKSFLAWILQFIVIAIIIFILGLIGISIIGFSLLSGLG